MIKKALLEKHFIGTEIIFNSLLKRVFESNLEMKIGLSRKGV